MQRLPFFNYKFQNNSNGSCDVFIDGAIVDASTEQIYKDWWGDDTVKSFRSVRQQIDNSGANEINIFINSGGGQVTEAMAIHDYIVALQNAGKKVTCTGRGIIASAATYILMASNNSTISENSWFMIHNVSGFAYGDVNECENQVAMLRKFNDTITQFYTNATGLSNTVIGNMMNKETWLTGAEAKDKGFVKNVETNQNFTNSINQEQWLFNNTDVLSAYNSFTKINQDKMNIKELVMNALKEAGFIKNETDTTNYEGIATAVENALKPINEEIDTKVSNAVTEATKDLASTVTNAVTEAMKNVATPEAITTAVENAVKPINDELVLVKADIANKKGGEANPKVDPKNTMDQTGISWQA
jgi:ATP-dependent Clp protease, protease subunit